MDEPLRLGTVLPKPPTPEAVDEAAARLAASGNDVGACERCAERYTVTESGRIADHVCADRLAAIAGTAVQVPLQLVRPQRVDGRDWMEDRQ